MFMITELYYGSLQVIVSSETSASLEAALVTANLLRDQDERVASRLLRLPHGSVPSPCGSSGSAASRDRERSQTAAAPLRPEGLTGLGWAGLGWAGLAWAGLAWPEGLADVMSPWRSTPRSSSQQAAAAGAGRV